MEVDKASDEHRMCKIEKNQLLTICKKLKTKLSEELETNNNNLKEVDRIMRGELNKVKSEKDKIIKDQKSHYVSQNLDLLNKLRQLKIEHENLKTQSTTKDKESPNAVQQCEILGRILDNYNLEFKTMNKEIAQMKTQISDLTVRTAYLEERNAYLEERTENK
ncbi:hypothetical protein HA402_002532 [Bradysia odoriphaga]|nr:hypothetical protein HA402_002532 [Bradysia odoriphaga]